MANSITKAQLEIRRNQYGPWCQGTAPFDKHKCVNISSQSICISLWSVSRYIARRDRL